VILERRNQLRTCKALGKMRQRVVDRRFNACVSQFAIVIVYSLTSTVVEIHRNRRGMRMTSMPRNRNLEIITVGIRMIIDVDIAINGIGIEGIMSIGIVHRRSERDEDDTIPRRLERRILQHVQKGRRKRPCFEEDPGDDSVSTN
jgi:hypothetical protein